MQKIVKWLQWLMPVVVIIILMAAPMFVMAQDDSDKDSVLVAPENPETAEAMWPVLIPADNNAQYERVVGLTFSVLVGLAAAFVWFANNTRKDARDMLPPDFSKYMDAVLAFATIAAKMTPTDIDDRGIDAIYKLLEGKVKIETPPEAGADGNDAGV